MWLPGWDQATWHPLPPCPRAQVDALHNLGYQLRQITHHEPFDHQKLAAKGEWVDAPDLVTLVEQEKHAAIKQLQVGCRRCMPPVPPGAAGCRCRHASPAATLDVCVMHKPVCLACLHAAVYALLLCRSCPASWRGSLVPDSGRSGRSPSPSSAMWRHIPMILSSSMQHTNG